jgi:hypothetical protein
MAYKQQERKYLNIKEASAHYEVSRAKLHRLIRSGRLRTEGDPRDERATLLSALELDALFKIRREDDMDTYIYAASEGSGISYGAGRLTASARARVDELRMRVSKGMPIGGDSVDILHEAREERGAQLDNDLDDGPVGRQA